MKYWIILFVFCFGIEAFSQDVRHNNYLDVSLGAAKFQGSASVSVIRQWNLGKKKRLTVGAGLRATTFLGKNQYYVTAPAKLTSGETGPQVIFIENITSNMDSFLIKTAQVNSLNIMLDFSYRISDKLSLGFDIDVIGFSLGGTTRGNYINGSQGKMDNASPTSFNVLLVSDNDKGTLNSEFYAKYFLKARWGVKAGAQFLFTEYTTSHKVQQLPEPNDRFRRKSLLFTAGISYKL
jgi:hypothetical protein